MLQLRLSLRLTIRFLRCQILQSRIRLFLKCAMHFIQLLDTQQLVYLYEISASNQQSYYKSSYIYVDFR